MKFSSNDETVKLQATDNSRLAKLDDMISEYQMFHEAWISKLKKIRDSELNGNEMEGSKEMRESWIYIVSLLSDYYMYILLIKYAVS